MRQALRVLLLEDPSTAERIRTGLEQAGFQPDGPRVETEADFVGALATRPAIVCAESRLPRMTAWRALQVLRERQCDIPLIVVTTQSESHELIVECLKQGAANYVHTDRLDRLGPAVSHALADQRARAEKRQAEVALRESEARYRIISELTSDFTYAFRVEPDGRLVWEWLTEAFTRITGYTLDEINAGGGWEGLVHPDDRPVIARRWEYLRSGRDDVCDLRIVTKAGETRLLLDHSRPVWEEAEGRVVRVFGAAQDITVRKRWEEALEHQALHDPLTELPNRLLLNDRLRQAVLAARRDQEPLALLVMDLDRFREINDTLGHAAGDVLLQQVGLRLWDTLRASDTVARLGGDEFAVLLPNTDAKGAVQAASKLQQMLQQPFVVAGRAWWSRPASASCSTRSTAATRPRSCAGPTWPCTWPSAPAAATASTRSTRTGTAPAAWP